MLVTGRLFLEPLHPALALKGLDASLSRESFAIRHAGSSLHERAGIFTGCPSTTLFSLVLGPA